MGRETWGVRRETWITDHASHITHHVSRIKHQRSNTMQQTVCDISFAGRVRIFSHDYLKCCVYISTFDEPQYIFTKKLYSKLISSSQLLEDFLDFHGAKNNTDWYLYRELSAAVRHLSTASYSQKHILNRLIFYEMGDKKAFEEQGEATLDFLTRTLMNIAPTILDEARRLKIPIPKDCFEPADFPGIVTSELLPCDIDDEDRSCQKMHIIKIASEFLSIARTFDQFTFYEPYTMEEMLEIVPDKINEVQIRRFEMLVHNLQSAFDTYVIHGGFKRGNRKLKAFRSSFSVVYHLLEMMGRLLHFYERHLHNPGYKDIYRKVQSHLSDLLPPERLLDRTINYAFYYVCRFLSNGRDMAREVLNENIERSSIKVGIPVKFGFHCRPSLLVAKIVQFYGGEVKLRVGEEKFDASSVLDIQYAGGKIQKENITQVTFEGDSRALKDIEILAGVNYGEDTMGKGVPLPKELSHIR